MSVRIANHGRRSGFTLIEMIIVVGAVALIGLGVARVFEATGETVATGRRVSRVNQATSLIERQIRADFESISRDGILLIRHEKVGDKRVDEIVFFANGNFTSQREPLHPQLRVTSNSARIYWGHGSVDQGRDPRGEDLLNVTDAPRSDLTPGGDEAPFPQGWTLLRMVTLLAMPSVSARDDLLPEPPTNWFRNRQADSRLQIGMQPAAPSMFRVFNQVNSYPFAADIDVARIGGRPNDVPQFASGLVDIAATSLDEIRAFILDAQAPLDFWIRGGVDVDPDRFGSLQPYGDPSQGDADAGAVFEPEWSYDPRSVAGLMQGWMRQLLPADSDGGTNGFNFSEARRQRVRCRRVPTDPFGIVRSGRVPGDGLAEQITLAQQRSDEQALLSSVIVPRCSSFRVEWSFGENYERRDNPNARPTQVIWHDLENEYEDEIDNLQDVVEGVVPYTYADGTRVTLPGGRNVARVYGRPNPPPAPQVFKDPWIVEDELIHGRDPSPLRRPDLLYSYFGFVDPTYPSPDAFDYRFRGLTPARVVGTNPPEIADKGMPPTMDWKWPKLLRFTIEVVDDASPELPPEVLQFVVELPEQDA